MANRVVSGQSMPVDEKFSADNGEVYFVFQGDGNLVLYTSEPKPIWASQTWGTGADRCVMQPDGNLVIYVGDHPRWASNTWGHAGAALVVQDDHNVVIYDNGTPIWDTNTPVGGGNPDVRVAAQPWGLVITLTHTGAQAVAAGGGALASIGAQITAAMTLTGIGAIAAGVVTAALAAVSAAIGGVDHGKGVYLTMLWLTPGIFIPTTVN